ncbi:MAG: flagellar basal body-associated FliL family protein [Acidobacteriota bacterium]|nr:flagellar basal body-associated FliL family protein [Acidobacteriota bacterium]
MATSPTALAGPPPAPSTNPLAVAASSRFPLVPVVLAVLASVLVALLVIGGGVYYLARSGRLPLPGAAPHKAAAAVPPPTHVMSLDPLLVNLADEGGGSYLRIAVALRVMDAPGQAGAAKDDKAKGDKGTNDAAAPVRDTLLCVLGRQTADELLASDGKEHLKAALKGALAEHTPEVKVADVYFTDFLVQR